MEPTPAGQWPIRIWVGARTGSTFADLPDLLDRLRDDLGLLYEGLPFVFVVLQRSSTPDRWMGNAGTESTVRELARRYALRPDTAVAVVAEGVTVLRTEVAYGGGSYAVTVSAEVIDAVAVAEAELLDVEAALVAHFRRAGSGVTVGGGVATAQGAGDLAATFTDDPPRLPGLTLRLVDVEPVDDADGAEFVEDERPRAYGVFDFRPDRDSRDLGAAVSIIQILETAAGGEVEGTVYTSGADGSDIVAALSRLTGAFGHRTRPDGEPHRGSWWTRVVSVFSADEAPPVDAFDVAATTYRAEQVAARKRAADEQIYQRTLELIDTLEDHEEAVVHLDRLLVVKSAGKLLVRELDPTQASFMRANDDVLRDPGALYAVFASGFSWERMLALSEHFGGREQRGSDRPSPTAQP